MSFGFSVGDFVLLTQLAYNIVQNTWQACGAHDTLTQEVTSLHLVLRRLELEASKPPPSSILSRVDADSGHREELRTILTGCDKQLKVLDQVLTKYNGLSEDTKKTTRLWQKIRFGNGEMRDLGKIRQELATHTSAITLFLNLQTMGSQGRVETHMENHSEELKELRSSLNWITASLQAKSHSEGSILSSYAGDDKRIWKEFRRELVKEGFSSASLHRNKRIIKEYVLELGERGALDTPVAEDFTVVKEVQLQGELEDLPIQPGDGTDQLESKSAQQSDAQVAESKGHPFPESDLETPFVEDYTVIKETQAIDEQDEPSIQAADGSSQAESAFSQPSVGLTAPSGDLPLPGSDLLVADVPKEDRNELDASKSPVPIPPLVTLDDEEEETGIENHRPDFRIPTEHPLNKIEDPSSEDSNSTRRAWEKIYREAERLYLETTSKYHRSPGVSVDKLAHLILLAAEVKVKDGYLNIVGYRPEDYSNWTIADYRAYEEVLVRGGRVPPSPSSKHDAARNHLRACAWSPWTRLYTWESTIGGRKYQRSRVNGTTGKLEYEYTAGPVPEYLTYTVSDSNRGYVPDTPAWAIINASR